MDSRKRQKEEEGKKTLEELLKLYSEIYTSSEKLLKELNWKNVHTAIVYESNALTLKYFGNYEKAKELAEKAWKKYMECFLFKKAILVAKRFKLDHEYLVNAVKKGYSFYSSLGLHDKVYELLSLLKKEED